MGPVRGRPGKAIAGFFPGPWWVPGKTSPAATPETVSVAGTVSTVELVAGLGLADQAGAPNVGTDTSTLTLTDAELVLPAMSMAVPVIVWPTPSVGTVWSAGQVATPEVSSAQV